MDYTCSNCGYDLCGLTGATCPECGYTPTSEESFLSGQRADFLRHTKWRQWCLLVLPIFAFVPLFFVDGVNTIAEPGILLCIAAVAWAEIARRLYISAPRGMSRTIGRAWRLSLGWLVLPVSGIAWAAGALWLSSSVSFLGPIYEYGWICLLGSAIGTLSAFLMWKWSFGRLLRIAGLTVEWQDLRKYGKAALATIFLSIILSLGLVLLILDTFFVYY